MVPGLARTGLAANARHTPLLPRVDRAGLGKDHEPGLRQHGARADRDEVTRRAAAPAQPPSGEQRPPYAPHDRSLSDRIVTTQSDRYRPPSTGICAPLM